MARANCIFVEMYIMYKTILSISFLLFIFSCTTSTNNEESGSDTATDSVAAASIYEYQRAFTQLKWTAYKTSAKLPVGGSFSSFEVATGSPQGSVADLLTGLTFRIDVSSSNSGEEERDGKIAQHFYAKMLNTSKIIGEITTVEGDANAGKANITIELNEVSHEVEGTYTIDNKTLTLETTLDLNNWKAEEAIANLNSVCNDLHTGEDGISKLWPDVQVTVTSVLKSVDVVASNTSSEN